MEELLLAESDDASRERLARLRKDLADRREDLAALTARWEKEKAGLNLVGDLKARLDALRSEAERLLREGDLASASAHPLRRDPGAGEASSRPRPATRCGRRRRRRMIKDKVGPDEVADVVAQWTGIPAGRLLEGETEKLLRMEEVLGARLIGQIDAVARCPTPSGAPARASPTRTGRPARSCSSARPASARPSWPRRSRTSSSTTSAPWSGSTCPSTPRSTRSPGSSARPPGYVGYEEGGQLTEAVRRRPYSVVLLDEVEKAHPEVFDVLLQVLDDGRLTDGQGRTVDFRNVILVLTSNLGSQYLVDPLLSPETRKEAVMGAVRPTFKPEFLNRLDDVVLFDPLSLDELGHIVDLQVDALANRLRDRRLTLDVTEAAGVAGARGLRPGLRCPTAAAAGAARDRRPAGQGAARPARSATATP